jgi:hypothetical protein
MKTKTKKAKKAAAPKSKAALALKPTNSPGVRGGRRRFD